MVEAEGLEPTTHTNKFKGGTWACTRELTPRQSPPGFPPELLAVADSWHRLPDALRKALLALLDMGENHGCAGHSPTPEKA